MGFLSCWSCWLDLYRRIEDGFVEMGLSLESREGRENHGGERNERNNKIKM
jgi:hypothetical protein